MRGNVIDMAVGIIIGAAFGKIVNSLVKDIVMPPIGILTEGIDFTNKFVNLSGESYTTLAEAQKAGAATINYGVFLNTVIMFLIVASCVFFLVKQVSRLKRKEDVTFITSTKNHARIVFKYFHQGNTLPVLHV